MPAPTLENQFSRQARSRGDQYFYDGRVAILETGERFLAARCRGSSEYVLTLRVDDDTAVLSCSCPVGWSYEACKHMWALIREAERRGIITPEVTFLATGDGDESYEDEDEIFEPVTASPRSDEPAWTRQLRNTAPLHSIQIDADEPPPGELIYDLDVATNRGIFLSIRHRPLKKNGTPGRPQRARLTDAWIASLSPSEQEIVAVLSQMAGNSYFHTDEIVVENVFLRTSLALLYLPRLAATSRLYLERDGQLLSVTWNDGPVQIRPEITRSSSGESWLLGAAVHAPEDLREAQGSEHNQFLPGGIAVLDTVFTRYEPAEPDSMALRLLNRPSIVIPVSNTEELRQELLLRGDPTIDLPEELRWTEEAVTPRTHLSIAKNQFRAAEFAELRFDYDGLVIQAWDRRHRLQQGDRVIIRDLEYERDSVRLVNRFCRTGSDGQSRLKAGAAVSLIGEAIERGWRVTASGRVLRSPRSLGASITSGIDWFDVDAKVDFGEVQAPISSILTSLRRGERQIVLSDGSVGMIPDDWAERLQRLASFSDIVGDGIRFRNSQLMLIDALLEEVPDVDFDVQFHEARERLSQITAPQPLEPPPTFVGTLRPYQKEALGWMQHLRDLGFGGCLADDMGLGKTVQVLAMLEERRASGSAQHPTLVVVPRSLIFNWSEEASRFTPAMKVIDYSGTARSFEAIDDAHIVLTTYGTLRRDVKKLASRQFDYVILDEAQAIKNSGSQSAKATLVLRSQHRLALSGTPIENHLGELGSLFGFLNPGMLSRKAMAAQTAESVDREMIARAVRPFILRRTKSQVERDLPERVEQTLYCEMEPAQKALYESVKLEYRLSLQKRIDTGGLAKAKIHVLEALLRLRQIACHPRLVSDEVNESTKMDTLLPLIEEIAGEKHQILLFSQFTSLLALVREELDKRQVPYLYLDGATRDRKALVDQFQTTGVPVFLISLKAGGVGLNLTAADYVILLDPWWNPAVEAQAIDRAHRIGQTRRVIAYRLVTRDTVEEKILELQKSKRELAEAILTEDNSLVRRLTAEDLALLME